MNYRQREIDERSEEAFPENDINDLRIEWEKNQSSASTFENNLLDLLDNFRTALDSAFETIITLEENLEEANGTISDLRSDVRILELQVEDLEEELRNV